MISLGYQPDAIIYQLCNLQGLILNLLLWEISARINGLFILLPFLSPSSIRKRTWHPGPNKMVILSLPSSQSAGFPNKANSGCLNPESPRFISLSCSEQSELGQKLFRAKQPPKRKNLGTHLSLHIQKLEQYKYKHGLCTKMIRKFLRHFIFWCQGNSN